MSLVLGQSIRIIRQARGITSSELAKQASISTAFLSLVESAKRTPSIGVLQRLAKALDVPIVTLLFLAGGDRLNISTRDHSARALAGAIRRLAQTERNLKDRLGRHRRTKGAPSRS